jgi:hypothetical protein
MAGGAGCSGSEREAHPKNSGSGEWVCRGCGLANGPGWRACAGCWMVRAGNEALFPGGTSDRPIWAGRRDGE